MKTISGYGSGWKLPDKLRIIKPLEGSLTLHQWQRLAKPSLEGIFEERKGVVMRGSRANNLTITEEDQISGEFFLTVLPSLFYVSKFLDFILTDPPTLREYK